MSITLDERIETKIVTKVPKKYNLWALNNDLTAYDEVIWILTNALGMNPSVAAELTLKVDSDGRAKLNPSPLSYGLAQAYLNKLNDAKRRLASQHLIRRSEIMELKFITKED